MIASKLVNISINWKCKRTWKIASFNTSWCLVGCSIGDLGTIAYFQFTGIAWPVWAIMTLAIFNGIMTSIMLETLILVRQMPVKLDFKTALTKILTNFIKYELLDHRHPIRFRASFLKVWDEERLSTLDLPQLSQVFDPKHILELAL